MKTFTTIALSLAIAVLGSTSTLARDASPPFPADGGQPQSSELIGGTVTAVVVRSWGFSSDLVWEHLSLNWSLYGTTPISIDYTTLINAPSITLADLQNVGADVVIVSDPSGGTVQWTPDEVAALETYALAGHNLVGTYLLLQFFDFDNRGLAPLWGLDGTMFYDFLEGGSEPESIVLKPSHCLFDGIGDTMDVGGYPSVQVPQDDLKWDFEDVDGADVVALGADGHNIVTTYDAGPYVAHFISYMPEYQHGEFFEATQWLYNAITCTAGPISVEDASWGEVKASYR